LHRRGISTNSEAFRYLSRFHQATNNGDEMAIERVQRPVLRSGHHSTTSITSLNTAHTPSLAQSPATASSSLSTSTDYSNLTYDFNTRPLPPRRDPSFSSSAGAPKGIDLVLPHVGPPAEPAMAGSMPDNVPFHGGVWEKQTVKKLPAATEGDAKEGLGALFGGGEKK
jgi:ECL1/2/3 zinc binding proteins